jgi:hypothetical protein
MSPMVPSLGPFRAALLIGWMVLGVAGWWYAAERSIPAWAAVPAVAAFLLEYPFYLAAGFEAVRERLRSRWLPLALLSSAIAPYLVYSLGTGQFRWNAAARLVLLFLLISTWYAFWRPRPLVDLGFLALVALPLVLRYFDGIYLPAVERLDLEVLGHLALIHVSALALLVQRGGIETGFGFVPRPEDWKIGIRYFLYFLPLGAALAWTLQLARWGEIAPWWKILGTFFGILWVVALSEEFFFRGVLLPWMAKWTRSTAVALAMTSVLFGLVHLPFRSFPNWRFALLAGVAGWFYGRAYLQANNIRAGMVMHALVVTTWRTFFS